MVDQVLSKKHSVGKLALRQDEKTSASVPCPEITTLVGWVMQPLFLIFPFADEKIRWSIRWQGCQLKFWNAPPMFPRNFLSVPRKAVATNVVGPSQARGTISWCDHPNCAVQYGNHQPHGAIKHLKCGQFKMKHTASVKYIPNFKDLVQNCKTSQ